MSFLTPQQYSRITGELQPHMEQDVRRAHIEGTFHGHVVMQHIGNWTASNYVFTSELMEQITTRCDKEDLIRLLGTVKDTLGTNRQREFDALIAELRGDHPPSQLEDRTYVRAADAKLVKTPDRDLRQFLTDADVTLIGRDAVRADIRGRLDAGTSVLVHGFSGSGKTALAAQIAADWQTGGAGTVLSVTAGDANPEPLLEAIGTAFDAGKAVASAPDLNTKTDIVHDLLTGHNIKLVLVDDAWNGAALRVLLAEALPRGVPALVTARQRYAIPGDMVELTDVDDPAALDMLRAYAGTNVDVDAGEGAALCRKLGNLAFALRVAGRTMKTQALSARELLDRLNAHQTAQDMEIPLGFRRAERRSLAVLIEQSLDTLPGDARAVFMALGAFFAPTITAEMMALYLIGEPDIPDEMLAQVREQNPHLPEDMSDDDLRPRVARALQKNVDAAPADEMLMKLMEAGLMTRIPRTDTAIAHYRTHDLGHAYAAASADDTARRRAVRACIAYTENYNEPSLTNFAALTPELDNFEGASAWAFAAGMDDAVEDFAWNLFANEQPGVLYMRGMYTRAVPLLERAAACAERAGNRRNQGAHLNHMALAYDSLGQYERAIPIYEQIVVIFREIDDKKAEGSTLGNLGNAYHNLGQYEQAIEYHKQALEIHREIGDRRGEGADLGNLGTAYKNLGQVQRAIRIYEQIVVIFREIGNRRGEGSVLGSLGNAYYSLGQYEQAIEYHQQALAISREIGDRVGESNGLNNLGATYEYMEQYARALDYYQQALAIFQALNLPHRVELVERNIAIVRGKMSGGG